MKNYITIICFTFFCLVAAQNPAAIENTFNVNNVTNVSGGALFGYDKCFPMSNNKIMVYQNCGLCRVNGEKSGKIEVLNSDGQLDAVFNSFSNGFIDNVNDTYLFTDGKVLIGGTFLEYNGIVVNGLVKINSDGTIDNTFTTTLNGGVSKILVQPDGKIIVVGRFTTYNGILNNRIIRLNMDGSIDSTFNSGIGSNNFINTALLQTDGKIIIAGRFTSFNNNTAIRIARLNNDGSFDNTFVSGVGFNFEVNSLSHAQDNKIFVGGNFTSYNGVTKNRIVKLNLDGTVDNSFVIGSGFDSFVKKILLLSDGYIAVFGEFSAYKGVFLQGSIKLDNLGNKINNSVFSKKKIKDSYIQNDGKIIIVGDFSSIENIVINSIAKLNSNESLDSSFAIGVGFNFTVNKVKQQNDGKILVCGGFSSYNNAPSQSLARLNQDGTIDGTFNIGTGFNSTVTSFDIQPDGKIIVVGYFTSYNGISVNKIVRLNQDGTIDSSFIGSSIKNISHVKIQNDGKIICALNFSGSDNKILRLNTNGAQDLLYFFTNADITTIELQTDGKLMIASLNVQIGYNNIYRYNTNGLYDGTFSYILTDSGNVYGGITAIAFQTDGKIVVGGGFFTSTNNLKRLNTNGTVDNTFITGSGFSAAVTALLVQPDNRILVGGRFTSYNNVNHYQAIRLNVNGTIDNSFDLGTGFTGEINEFSLQNDGKILVAGAMVNYSKYTIGGLVRLIGGGFYNLSGQNKLDTTSNGCDINDIPFPNLKMNFNNGIDNYDFFVENTGNYEFLLSHGSYTITPYVNQYFSVSPASISATFPSQFTSLVQNYCITPTTGNYTDLEIQLIPLTLARPGFDAKYKMQIKNNGIVAQSGSLNFTFDDQVLDYISSSIPFTTQSSSLLTFDFNTLNPQESRSIIVTLNLNSPQEMPPLNNDDLLSFNASFENILIDITPNDNIFTLNQGVVNSYDPNDIQCLEGKNVGVEKIGNYVHYMIRFENKGTANAEFIVVENSIDLSKFDISTFEPLSGSHQYLTKITNGNKVQFFFNNINLPFDDANNDGYLIYKIKLKSTLIEGNEFSNVANIYFDFNPAIITNIANTTISSPLNLLENINLDGVNIYPNPAQNILNIDFKSYTSAKKLEIYNMIGQLIFKQDLNLSENKIDIQTLSDGTHILNLTNDNITIKRKFIKN